MRPASAALLLAAAAALAGCTVEATGLRVTVRTHGVPANRLDVTVLRDGRSIGTGNYSGDAKGDIDDGDTFGVQLPDSLDGTVVSIRIEASNRGEKTGTGMNGATVRKQQAVELTIDLVGTSIGDLGVDLAGRDTAVPDLAGLDLAMPDDLVMQDLAVAMPDLALEDSAAAPEDFTVLDGPMPDRAMPDQVIVDLPPPPPDLVCDPTCANGTYTYCDKQNMKVAVPCGFGCNGPQCNGPNACNVAGDISSPGTYWATTLGSKATATGSCQVVGGPDNTLTFKPQSWSKVTLALNASFPAALWARSTCGDPVSELVANNIICNMANAAPACVAGNQMQQLVLCGLPPGVQQYAFVEHPVGPGGLYSITATYAAVNLNDCRNAGMMPGLSFSRVEDTSGQQPLQAAPMQAVNCPADRGAASPEMVFWAPLSDAVKTMKLTVKVTGMNGFVPFLYSQSQCQSALTVCYPTVNGVAQASFAPAGNVPIFFFVDGLNGAKGQFKLDMTLTP